MSKFWNIDYKNQKRREKNQKKYVKLPPLKKKPTKKLSQSEEAFENFKENIMINSQTKIFNRGIYHLDNYQTKIVSEQYIKIVLSKSSSQIKKEYKNLLDILETIPFPGIEFYEEWFYNKK